MTRRLAILRAASPVAIAVACALLPRAALAAPPDAPAVAPTPPAPEPSAVPAPPAPAPAAPPPPAQVVVLPSSPPCRPATTRRTVAFAAAGVAVIGAGLATTFGVLALHNRSLYQTQPTLSNSDHGNDDAAYADGAIALAVAAGVTSLVLFLTDDSASPGARAPAPNEAFVTASPFVTAHGGGAGALVRF